MLIVTFVCLIMACNLIFCGIRDNNNPVLIGMGTNLISLIFGVFVKAPRFAKDRTDLSV